MEPADISSKQRARRSPWKAGPTLEMNILAISLVFWLVWILNMCFTISAPTTIAFVTKFTVICQVWSPVTFITLSKFSVQIATVSISSTEASLVIEAFSGMSSYARYSVAVTMLYIKLACFFHMQEFALVSTLETKSNSVIFTLLYIFPFILPTII